MQKSRVTRSAGIISPCFQCVARNRPRSCCHRMLVSNREESERGIGIMDEKLVEFDKIYWLSQPPEVRALEINTTPDQDIRMGRGIELAIKGFKIDVPIMLWGWDPYKVMKLRMDYGYTWVPNALQPRVGAAPGLTGPGIIPYDPNNPPGGAIKVSVNLADYPPFDPPIPPPPSPAQEGPVGVQSV